MFISRIRVGTYLVFSFLSQSGSTTLIEEKGKLSCNKNVPYVNIPIMYSSRYRYVSGTGRYRYLYTVVRGYRFVWSLFFVLVTILNIVWRCRRADAPRCAHFPPDGIK